MWTDDLSMIARRWFRDAFRHDLDEFVDDPHYQSDGDPERHAQLLTKVAEDGIWGDDHMVVWASKQLAKRDVTFPVVATGDVDSGVWAQSVVVNAIVDYYRYRTSDWTDLNECNAATYLLVLREVAGYANVDFDRVVAEQVPPQDRERLNELVMVR